MVSEPDIASPDQETARNLYGRLENVQTQAELVKILRAFENAVTNIFADLLEPKGYGCWKLILKRSNRGAPRKDPHGLMSFWFDQEIAERGKRGAIKRLAKELKMSPDAVRAAIRREDPSNFGIKLPARRRQKGRK
jgi:hypothetical protein